LARGRAPTDPNELAARHAGEVASSIEDALARAHARYAGELVVIAGSIYLVGQARGVLLGLPRDPPVAL
jgi:hypothetical protein